MSDCNVTYRVLACLANNLISQMALEANLPFFANIKRCILVIEQI